MARLYVDNAFLICANSSYRSLFWRLIESIELLSVLLQCQNRRKALCQRSATSTALTESTHFTSGNIYFLKISSKAY